MDKTLKIKRVSVRDTLSKLPCISFGCLRAFNKQAPLPFEGDVFFSKVEAAIGDFSKVRPFSAAPNSYLQALLQEAKLKIALFISTEKAQQVFEQIYERNWEVNHYKISGVNVREWIMTLDEAVTNREKFLKQIIRESSVH